MNWAEFAAVLLAVGAGMAGAAIYRIGARLDAIEYNQKRVAELLFIHELVLAGKAPIGVLHGDPLPPDVVALIDQVWAAAHEEAKRDG